MCQTGGTALWNDKEPSQWKPGFLIPKYWSSFCPLKCYSDEPRLHFSLLSFHHFTFQFHFSSSNIWTNKPLQFVCIKRVSWADNEIMQKVNVMSVITSRITVPPKLCSNTVRVSVWIKNCTPKYTEHTSVTGIDNNQSYNSLDVGFFHEWDCWGATPTQPFQHSHCWKSKLRIILFREGRALWSASKEEMCTKALFVLISFASQYFLLMLP